VGVFDLIEPQRAGQGIDHRVRDRRLAALLQAAVMVRAEPGKDGEFLFTQPGHPALAREGGHPGLRWSEAVSPRPQKLAERAAVTGHPPSLSQACRYQTGHAVPRLGSTWAETPAGSKAVFMTSSTAPSSPFRLAGRHAVVTGSTSGIGAATARALAAQGARVVVTGRDRKRGEAVVATIGEAATFIPSDLAATPAEIRAFAAVATDALDGRIDILINNAALCPPTNTVGLTDADLESTLAVNIRAPHVLVAALAPPMAERGTGVVVTIGSWMASVGSPIVGLYSATKAAEEQLSRSWAAEFGPRGVRFNVVSPGVTRTPINDTQGDLLDQIAAGTPAGRTVHPEDVAHAVAWLASDAAALIHGITLPVDGGISTTRLG